MSVQWLHGCSTEQERKDRKSLILGATPALEVLLNLVEQSRAEAEAVREADYQDAAWAYKQAHLNGRLEELDKLANLIRSALDHNDL